MGFTFNYFFKELNMPSAAATVALAVGGSLSGGTSTSFSLSQRAAGLPTIWSRSTAASGSMVGQETISYAYKLQSSNLIVTCAGRLPTVVVDSTTGMDVVSKTVAYDVKFSLPRNASLTERTRAIDVAVAHLFALRAGIVAGESYF